MPYYCTEVGCTNKAQTRGLCRRHYDEARAFERDVDARMVGFYEDREAQKTLRVAQTDYDQRKHTIRTAYVLAIFGGFLGLHKFYLGKPFQGLLFIVTIGGLLIWWIIDLVTLSSQVRAWNRWLAGEVAAHHRLEVTDLTL